MKHVIKKVKAFWNTEFEISLSKRPGKQNQPQTKQPEPYVNPFKHQQDLAEIKRRYEAMQQKSQAKSIPPVQSVQPVKPAQNPEPPKPVIVVPAPALKPKLPPQPKPQPKFTPTSPPINPLDLMYKESEPEVTANHSFTTQQLKKHKHASKLKKQHVITTAVIIAVLYITVPAFMVLGQAKQPVLPPPQILGAQEQAQPAAEMVEAVSKKITLPEDETPTIATVTDPAKLQNQKFFQAAQSGDKLFIFKKNKKVYLYRPSTDEVLGEAPLQFEAAK